MNRLAVVLIVVFAVLAGWGNASAGDSMDTGYDLHHALLLIDNPTSERDMITAVRAIGYVDGFLNGLSLMQDMIYRGIVPEKILDDQELKELAELIHFKQLNIPQKGVPVGQGITIYQKWATIHSEELDKTARICLLLSFVDAFGWK